MESNQSIIITKCVNGYVVNEFKPDHALGRCDSQLVFQSMQMLVQFIRKHFDYRGHDIEQDQDMTKE